MLKHVLLAGSMMVAAPALAQTAPASPQGDQTTPTNQVATPGRTPMTSAPVQPVQPADNAATTAPADAIAATPADPATTTAQAAPAPAAPAQSAPAQTAQAQTPQAQPAPAQPAQGAATADAGAANGAATQGTNQPTQVAAIVDREFGAYDKDADGKLNKTEFGAWMVALKTQSDPATKPDSPETTKWVNAAFAQADTGKSGALTKQQLVSFLSQGQSS